MKEYQIRLDPPRMRHYGVNVADVMAATRGIGDNPAGGVLYEYGNEYTIRAVASADVMQRLENAVVKSDGEWPVRLADVADIRIGGEEPRLGAASVRARDAVLLTVTKQPGTGTIPLTERLEEVVADASASFPADVRVATDIFRQSSFIDASISNVKTSLIEGGIFVVIILFLFLGNVRTTVISLVTIPVALLVTIITLRWLGESINTMSLGGMAIAIGSLVDDAIVDVENVWRHLRLNHALPPERRRGIRDVVFEASREVRLPILNSTLIIIVSFVPLFFLNGMEGRMLIPLGAAFITALLASTLVALTLTPVLCSWLLSHPEADSDARHMERESWITRRLKGVYGRSLEWALLHRRGVLGATVTIFVLAIGVFFTLGSSFLPPFNEGSFTINVSTMPGVSLAESEAIGRRAEEILLQVPEIRTVARKTGRAELDEHALGVNVSEIEAPFELAGRPHADMLADVRARLSEIKGANIEIGQPISHRIDAMLSGTRAGIAIKLFGPDLPTLFSTANRIKDEIAGIEGIADLNVEQQIERPEIHIVPKPLMLARLGISEPAFNEYVAVMLGGEKVGRIFEADRSFDLVVRGHASARNSIEDLENLTIWSPAAQADVALTDVAEIRSVAGPASVSRENVKRKIVISANAAGRDIGSVMEDIRSRIADGVELPEGYHLEYGGQFESRREAGRTLFIASLLSILVIFLLLYLEFGNLRESAAILLNLPFALIGGVLVLRFTSGEVSIPAIIGFISLFGIATRNGMLLITRFNQLHSEGVAIRESVTRGATDRMNPILMTALTSALALIPLAARGDLPGNEIQAPMAMVILGGLITSTLLNFYIIPIIYLRLKKAEQ